MDTTIDIQFWVIVKKSSPKKPVGQLSVDCRPTDYRQLADRLPTGYR